MSTLNTSNQGIPYPDHNEYLKFAWQQIRDAVLAIEPKLNMVFANSSDLATRVPSPTEGMVAWMQDANVLQVYDGSSWKRVYPSSPAIYSGSGAPSSGLGTIGDLYFQTS